MFENARVVKKAACTATAYSSMKVPHRGNVLVIGDAAAYVEVETQGALTCGYRAADAVFDEIEIKKDLKRIQNGGRTPLSSTGMITCRWRRGLLLCRLIRMTSLTIFSR